ncbi:ral guanine nucleotide dissociation stimulator-like 3 isoform X2 [Mauremys mutica]|uniref:ral guanine nucleotide dissociation stimulator-like 3 isoform X2 n=1 Tax=Mauremys mutica TaxID=74926 RepID=UPI001D16859F|nr:ral guanine nucleotide dissociation stimulator-like 3 isoform X2 [Mauremys mutica]
MEPLQQWGEEVEDGAIYSVTLQRVRAEPAAHGGPCPLAGAGPPCPFVQYRTCKLRRLRAGTLPQLVRGLVSASAESDPGYLPSFLATYRAFATPGRVLELLLPLGPDSAVLQVLELWLRDHPEDFREPPQHPSLRQLHGYLRQAAPGSEGCARAEGLLQSFQEEPGDEQAEPESKRLWATTPRCRLSPGYNPCLRLSPGYNFQLHLSSASACPLATTPTSACPLPPPVPWPQPPPLPVPWLQPLPPPVPCLHLSPGHNPHCHLSPGHNPHLRLSPASACPLATTPASACPLPLPVPWLQPPPPPVPWLQPPPPPVPCLCLSPGYNHHLRLSPASACPLATTSTSTCPLPLPDPWLQPPPPPVPCLRLSPGYNHRLRLSPASTCPLATTPASTCPLATTPASTCPLPPPVPWLQLSSLPVPWLQFPPSACPPHPQLQPPPPPVPQLQPPSICPPPGSSTTTTSPLATAPPLPVHLSPSSAHPLAGTPQRLSPSQASVQPADLMPCAVSPAGCESPGDGPLVLGGEGGPEGCGESPDLLSFSVEEVAEQLTLMDIELFMQVRPFHCLGCVWSQRDREGAAPSVRATVAQFNAVTSCVVASVLGDVQLRAPQRARLLEKWVAIAQHCCVLRNFSSLRAVISALQSSPVHRLKRTWAAVSRDTMGIFRKLSQIFSDDKNHLSCREILLQGDAAQGVPEGAPSPRVARKATQKLNPPEKPAAPPPGTVPYLGTFLTDLVMLDTALPDFLEGGLINFEKRRKEAEILLRIQQLQASCRGYALRPNPPVLAAFQRHGRLAEEQSYRVSRLIEPPADSCPNSPRVKRSLSKRFSSLLLGAEALPPRLPSAKGSISPAGTGSSCEADEGPSAPCFPEVGGPLGKSLLELPVSTCPPEEPPSPLARCPGSPLYNQQGADSCIVRVSVDNAHGNLYRSILLTSQDKTPAVVLRGLQKHGLDGTPPGAFQLLQLLGGGRELLIPDGANAFYAMNPAANFDFVLRRKGPPSPRLPRPTTAHKTPPPLPPSPALTTEPPLPSPPGPFSPPAPRRPGTPPCSPLSSLPAPSTSPRQPPPASPP